MTYQLGIDLGTTYTAAAVHRNGRVEIVPLGNRAASIPSVVFLREDETILTGDAANRRGLSEPDRLAREFKRRMGDTTPLLIGGTPYSAERLLARLLRWVVDTVTEREGGPPDAIAVSHPANWGPYKTDLLAQAVRQADLPSAAMITEPEAAAISYATNERVEPGAVVAVYDLGGGTFDAAVLRKTEDGFEILGEPEGIERLGGIDFDEAVFEHVRRSLDGALEALDFNDPNATAAVSRLRQECVDAKEALSGDTDASIPVLLPSVQTEVRITRAEFEAMIRPPLAETTAALRRALASSGVSPEQVHAVLLVGGSSRIPIVGQLVSAEFGRPVAVDAHPKHAIALGAALAAAQASGGSAASTDTVVVDAAAAGAAAAGAGAVAAVASRADAPTEAVPTAEAVPTEAVPTADAAPTEAVPTAATTTSDAAVPTGIAPAQPGATPPPATPEGKGSSKVLIGVAAVLAVVVIAAVAVFALGGGDDGDEVVADDQLTPTTDASVDPDPEEAPDEPDPITDDPADPVDPVDEGPVVPTCESSSGRCAFITDIELAGDTYLVSYDVVGYEPVVDGGPGSHHMHFYFNSLEAQNAGTNGPNPGVHDDGSNLGWIVWDVPDPFDGYGPGDRPAGADELCVLVADVNHGVELGTGNCVALP